MISIVAPDSRLLGENAELRARLEEAEETLRAIRAGEVDALVVDGVAGPQVFILQSSDAGSYRFSAAILSKVSDAVVAIDNEQRVIFINAAAAHQYGVIGSQVLGQQVNEVFESRWVAAEDGPAFAASLATTGEWCGESLHVKRDGVVIHVESAVSRLSGKDGGVAGQLSVIRDITDRCAAEGALLPNGRFGSVCYFADVTRQQALESKLVARSAALAHADRTKDEFLAMLAHELRNPLAPMRNAAEILSGRSGPGERKQAQLIISRQIENMSRMIDDLLDVSRITDGKIELKKEAVELEPILRAAASLARPGCAALGQQLAVHYPDRPIRLMADATRLEQVLGNLLGNACKHGGDGCRISLAAEIDTTCDPPEVVIRVKDDGQGIDPDLLPRIFELFVQASRTLDRAHGGLGIGLTLVQRLVILHGGRVEARSAGLGRGSEFIVRLPILESVAPPPAPARSPVPADKPVRILIVDDNLDAAESMAMLQQIRGHETKVAHTGPDAVRAASEFLPQVVLLDIGLPGMDGYQVARRLRAMPGVQDAFLVAMTGYGSDEDRCRAKQAGFDEHLAKPADLDLLRGWLRTRV